MMDALSNNTSASTLRSRLIETPLGPLFALADIQGLHLLDFAEHKGIDAKIAVIEHANHASAVPGDHPILDQVAESMAAYFRGETLEFQVPLALHGSAWQLAVWSQLRTIPPGETKSYAQVARELGRPTGSRAVGNANGQNFLAIVIPCHRVIGANGTLRGYGGGLHRKYWLIDHERQHSARKLLLF